MDGDYSLKDSRNNLVAKANKFIQQSRLSLELTENKAVLYLISKIRPDDEPGKIYVFNCREFQELLLWNREASYLNSKIMLQNIADKSIWLDEDINGRKKEILMRWFDIVRMDPGSGDIEISFHEDMFPYLLNLSRHYAEEGMFYTTYRLQNVTLMKHRYSPRIYELLKSYQFNNKRWTFENGTGSEYDLQRRIADVTVDRKTRKSVSHIPEGWANWAIFRRNVLEPAVEEINRYTDIKVVYVGKKEDLHHRKTKAIRTIEFYMAGKTDTEQRLTNDIIDAEYAEIESAGEQNAVADRFFGEHERSLEDDRRKAEARRDEENFEQYCKTRHPALFGELVDTRGENFDEIKLELLYNAAVRGRVQGIVPEHRWELFAADLVVYYYKIIAATPQETKTTTFNRLLDCVRRDSDNESANLLTLYGDD